MVSEDTVCCTRNSVVNALGGPSLAERSTGGPSTSRPFSRPAREVSVQEKPLDAKAMRQLHMMEQRRLLEEGRRREGPPKLPGRAHLPAHMRDQDAARRASGAAASSSTSSASSSARGAQKPALKPLAPKSRLGATSSTESKPLVVTSQDVEKYKGMPGYTFPDFHSDEILPPVATQVEGVYTARTPDEMGTRGLTSGSGWQQASQVIKRAQAELSPQELQRSFVEDIMPEEPLPVAAVGHGQSVSHAGSSANMRRSATETCSSGGATGAMGGATARSGGTSGSSMSGSSSGVGILQSGDARFGASLPGSQGKYRRDVTASAASSDTSQVCPCPVYQPQVVSSYAFTTTHTSWMVDALSKSAHACLPAPIHFENTSN